MVNFQLKGDLNQGTLPEKACCMGSFNCLFSPPDRLKDFNIILRLEFQV